MVTIQQLGKSTFSPSFISNVCIPVSQEILNISKFPFRNWVFSNFIFGIFIFKAIHGSVTDFGKSIWLQAILILILHILNGHKPNVGHFA